MELSMLTSYATLPSIAVNLSKNLMKIPGNIIHLEIFIVFMKKNSWNSVCRSENQHISKGHLLKNMVKILFKKDLSKNVNF